VDPADQSEPSDQALPEAGDPSDWSRIVVVVLVVVVLSLFIGLAALAVALA